MPDPKRIEMGDIVHVWFNRNTLIVGKIDFVSNPAQPGSPFIMLDQYNKDRPIYVKNFDHMDLMKKKGA